MKEVAFYTLGCKVNQYETNAIMQKFKEKGYEIVEFHEYADIYVINTCTVTNMSDRKSRQAISKAKKINPNATLAVIGCYAEVAKEELSKIKDIDIILGNNEKQNIIDYIENSLKGSDPFREKYIEYGPVTYTENTRAMIKIQDGCNQFCSYCIIPYARGRVRSRESENIIKEVVEVAKGGIKEIVITGIHIASYNSNEIKLIDVLERINKIEGIKRIRLGSLEPTLITKEFLDRLVKLEKVCDHFHLSLQSGCDTVLKRMNRKYTTKEFTEIVKLIREYYPNVNLTTDIIVGFPGEAEEEFNITYEFLKEIKFYQMHIFKYEKRKGTKAAEMQNQIDGNIKTKRSNILLELSAQNEKEIRQKYEGQTVEILVEKDGTGYTANYMHVNTGFDETYRNTMQLVKMK